MDPDLFLLNVFGVLRFPSSAGKVITSRRRWRVGRDTGRTHEERTGAREEDDGGGGGGSHLSLPPGHEEGLSRFWMETGYGEREAGRKEGRKGWLATDRRRSEKRSPYTV